MAAPRLAGFQEERSTNSVQVATESRSPKRSDHPSSSATGSVGYSSKPIDRNGVHPHRSVAASSKSSNQAQPNRLRQEWLSTTTPAIYGSVRARLPPTIDASVAPFCSKARQSFLNALLSDQLNALQPDYSTSFYDAEDVIRRLLPYHIWHIRDDDLLHVMGAKSVKRKTDAGSMDSLKVASTSKDSFELDNTPRHSKTLERYAELLTRQMDSFPSQAETDRLWQRFHSIERRAQKLRRRLTCSDVGQAPSPFYQESCYHLEHLARETEQESLNARKDEFRDAKEQAMTHGVTWEALMRISAGLELSNVPIMRHSAAHPDAGPGSHNTNVRFPTLSGAVPSSSMLAKPNFSAGSMLPRPPPFPLALPSAPLQNSPIRAIGPSTPVRGSRPRGRPRKQRDENGRIIRTPPAASTPPVPSPMATSSTPATLNVMHHHQREMLGTAMTADANAKGCDPHTSAPKSGSP